MSEKPIIQIVVGDGDPPFPSEQEVKSIRDVVQDELKDYDVLITTADVSLIELPALDDYADELAERIAERLNYHG